MIIKLRLNSFTKPIHHVQSEADTRLFEKGVQDTTDTDHESKAFPRGGSDMADGIFPGTFSKSVEALDRNAGTPERRNTKTRNTKLLKPGTHEN